MSKSSTSSPDIRADITAVGAARAGGPGQLGAHTVSRLGYGAMQLERLDGDRSSALALLHRALELGVDHIDTAQFYGDGMVNGLLREAFRPQDGVVIVSKVGADSNPGGKIPLRPAQRPEELRAGVEDNLRSLGLDQIPVVNLRRLDAGPGLRAEGDQIVDIDDQLAVMTAMRDEGLIGEIGVSSLTLAGLRRALPAGIVCVQNAYSLVSHDDEAMLALCRAEAVAWVPYFPLGGAFPGLPKVSAEPVVREAAERLGVTESQVGLAWLLRHAPNVLLIPGTADLAHLEANIAAASIEFDAELMQRLDAVPSRSTEVPVGWTD